MQKRSTSWCTWSPCCTRTEPAAWKGRSQLHWVLLAARGLSFALSRDNFYKLIPACPGRFQIAAWRINCTALNDPVGNLIPVAIEALHGLRFPHRRYRSVRKEPQLIQEILLCAKTLDPGFDLGSWEGSGTQHRFSNPYLPHGVYQGQPTEASFDEFPHIFVPLTTGPKVTMLSEGKRGINVRVAFFWAWIRTGISRLCQNENQGDCLQISRRPIESSRHVPQVWSPLHQ